MSAIPAKITYNFRRSRALSNTGIELVNVDGVNEDEIREGSLNTSSIAPAAQPAGKVPRITRMLALAHKFEAMLKRGEVESLADVARAGRVTRARLSQIMDLVLLAPDIQEQIMGFERVMAGRDPVTMRDVQALVRLPYWPEQRTAWRRILDWRSAKAPLLARKAGG
ncbi:MAG: hypothetical protein SF187_23555 [Deltaproteobacteria bacterium]|nr:hypothetical protein [Deltaproteobacteria bacterium]